MKYNQKYLYLQIINKTQNMNDKIEYLVQKFKKGSKIKIKESQKGSFTKYCNGKVTEECIAKGLRSPNPKIRKKANFARNARSWHHK